MEILGGQEGLQGKNARRAAVSFLHEDAVIVAAELNQRQFSGSFRFFVFWLEDNTPKKPRALHVAKRRRVGESTCAREGKREHGSGGGAGRASEVAIAIGATKKKGAKSNRCLCCWLQESGALDRRLGDFDRPDRDVVKRVHFVQFKETVSSGHAKE